MDGELMIWLTVFLGILGIGIGYGFWKNRATYRHVRQVRQRWRTQYTEAQRLFMPILANYYHNESQPYTTFDGLRPSDGALGLIDGAVIFHGRDHIIDLVIPFTALRWIGTHTINLTPTIPTKNALVIHYEEPVPYQPNQIRSRVAVFIAPEQGHLLQVLGEQTGLPVRHLGGNRPDLEPIEASRMTQNIHGQWSEKQTGLLYFASDRVLFNLKDPLLFSQVERIDVYDEESGLLKDLYLMSESLLTLKLRSETINDYHVVGFQTREAEALGQWLHDVTGLPFAVHEKHKKKPR